jgi:hypothetical protein
MVAGIALVAVTVAEVTEAASGELFLLLLEWLPSLLPPHITF